MTVNGFSSDETQPHLTNELLKYIYPPACLLSAYAALNEFVI